MISAYLDRFEGNCAVLLLGDTMEKVHFPRSFLPPDVSEGDYLAISMERDAAATEAAEDAALELLKD
jgi:hypothetical protein